jgi:histidinol dehydrogenase
MRVMSAASPEWTEFLRELGERGRSPDPAVEAAVRAILDDVRARGDAAVLEHTERLDGVRLDAATLRVSDAECTAALASLDPGVRQALALAADRITAFHARQQRQESWFTEEAGAVLGQLVRPLRRVGLYVPGGSAAYPSSVLMNALPAKVAGVAEIVMCTPVAQGRDVPPAVLAAARLAGVGEIYRVGGAQAIAAMAFGTATIPAVDKIVGPGNVYVATAKRLVFGAVGIDMVAGPSEVVVIADEAAPAAWVAADLLAQAEHDPLASAICITLHADMARAVQTEVTRQLALLPRRAIAEESLTRFGAVIVVEDLAAAVRLGNRLAPEHLELMVTDPWALLPAVRHAGAVFLGRYTPEVAGDYLAGPNHVLPTAGTARFSSPLCVDDFQTRSSLISVTSVALHSWREPVLRLAELEGLDAHANAIRIRTEQSPMDGCPLQPNENLSPQPSPLAGERERVRGFSEQP